MYFVTLVPWRLLMMSASLVNLVNAIAFCYLPETPKFLMEMNRPDETIAVLKEMYSTNTGLPENVSDKFMNNKFLISSSHYYLSLNDRHIQLNH